MPSMWSLFSFVLRQPSLCTPSIYFCFCLTFLVKITVSCFLVLLFVVFYNIHLAFTLKKTSSPTFQGLPNIPFHWVLMANHLCYTKWFLKIIQRKYMGLIQTSSTSLPVISSPCTVIWRQTHSTQSEYAHCSVFLWSRSGQFWSLGTAALPVTWCVFSQSETGKYWFILSCPTPPSKIKNDTLSR